MDPAHSFIRPSAAGRWVHCPGSASMEAAHPSLDSSHSAEGHACHNIAAMSLRGSTLYPGIGAVDHEGVPITQEMHDAAELYVQDVKRIAPDDETLNVEQPVTAATIHPRCFGTPDCWLYDSLRNILYIWDLKYGYGIVEAFKNWQLITYTAGIIHEYKLPENTLQVCLRIVQPRAHHPEGPIREWRVPATELRPHINKLFNSAALALDPGQRDTLHSGQHCRYCSGRHACPALRETAYYSVDISGRLEIENISSEVLCQEYRLLQAAADRIAYRLTGVEAQMIARTKSGDTATGHRLESALGRLSWDRPSAEVISMGDLIELDLRKAVEPITPSQAIKAGLNKDVAAAFSSRKPTAPKLVPSNQTLAATAFKQEV